MQGFAFLAETSKAKWSLHLDQVFNLQHKFSYRGNVLRAFVTSENKQQGKTILTNQHVREILFNISFLWILQRTKPLIQQFWTSKYYNSTLKTEKKRNGVVISYCLSRISLYHHTHHTSTVVTPRLVLSGSKKETVGPILISLLSWQVCATGRKEAGGLYD